MIYYTYILRCKDNTLYTGYTTDINRRMEEHFFKKKRGARYTKMHDAKEVVAVWSSSTKALACKLEAKIKKLSKNQKEELVEDKIISKYLRGKVDCRKYKFISPSNVLGLRYMLSKE